MTHAGEPISWSDFEKQRFRLDLAPAEQSKRTGTLAGCGKVAVGQRERTQGLKPDVFSIIYGPTKVVP